MEAATTRVSTLRVARVPLRPILGGLALAALIAGSLAVAIAAAQGHSFLAPWVHRHAPGWLTWPFGGLWPDRPNARLTLQHDLLYVVLAMLGAYLAALALARHIRPAVAWSAIGVVYLVLFLSPPLLLTDVFNYIDYARMGVLHGHDPYTNVPATIAHLHDPVYHLSNWHHLRSPYGPLFTLMTYALVPLGPAGAYWAFKALLLGASLGALALLARIARRLGRHEVRAVMLVGLNPIVLIFGAGGQHMDMFMVLLLLAALDVTLARREPAGAALSAAAAFVKASAAPLVPFFVAGAQRRGRALAGALAGAVALGVATLAGFGPHLPALRTQSRLVTPFSIPNIAGLALGRGGEDATVRAGAEALLAAALLACLVWAWRKRELLQPIAWASVATLVTLGSDMPWYMLWVLPFLALARGRAFRVVAVAACAWVTVQWLPLMPSAAHRLGFVPSRTSVWHANALYEKHLLK